MLNNEEASFSSSDEEIEVVSPPNADSDNILSVNLRHGTENGSPLPEGEGK